jgi:uncharacterized membrane protein (UPF0136 family)
MMAQNNAECCPGTMIQQGQDLAGHTVASAFSLLLAGIGGMRYAQTRKPMPALILFGLGSISAAYQANKVRQWM